MENCRREGEFFMRKYEEFLTTHRIRSEGIMQCTWTETVSVTLKTTTKKVLLQSFFYFQIYLVPVCLFTRFPQENTLEAAGQRNHKVRSWFSSCSSVDQTLPCTMVSPQEVKAEVLGRGLRKSTNPQNTQENSIFRRHSQESSMLHNNPVLSTYLKILISPFCC